MKKKKSRYLEVIIAYAPIIVALIAGYFGVRAATEPIRLQIEFTQTAEARQTAVANSLTQTALPATPFNNAIFTETLAPSTIAAPDFQNVTLGAPTGISIVRVLSENCVSSDAWIPYEKDSTIVSNNGCWDLSRWGFYSSATGLLLTPTSLPSEGIFHGIYLPVSGDVDVRFTIRVDKFDVDENYSANIGIGFISTNPPGPASAGIIYYHYIPADSQKTIQMKYGQNGQYEIVLPHTLEIGADQEVVLQLRGPLLTVIVDGIFSDPQILQFQDKAFWVSYSIPRGNNQLISIIQDLVVEQN